MDANQLEETKKKFLSSPNFAVVGASKDPTKFGTQVGSFPVSRTPFR